MGRKGVPPFPEVDNEDPRSRLPVDPGKAGGGERRANVSGRNTPQPPPHSSSLGRSSHWGLRATVWGQEVAMGQRELERCCGIPGPLWDSKDPGASSGGENSRSRHAKAGKRQQRPAEMEREAEKRRVDSPEEIIFPAAPAPSQPVCAPPVSECPNSSLLSSPAHTL